MNIPWGSKLLHICYFGSLWDFLQKLPKTQWMERDPNDEETFLHYAIRGNNDRAVIALIKSGIDIHWSSKMRCNAFQLAVYEKSSRYVLVLCALGGWAKNALSLAVRHDSPEVLYILIANGARLKSIGQHHITQQMVDFERGVLSCRSACVALMRLKRYYAYVDRFLFREMAFAVWETRMDEAWRLKGGSQHK